MKLSMGHLYTLRVRPLPRLLYILFSYRLAVSLYLWGSGTATGRLIGIEGFAWVASSCSY